MGDILTSDQLAYMRDTISDNLLPDTCNILDPTNTPDGLGGFDETWGTATASAACRVDQKKRMETDEAGALRPASGWVLTLAHDQAINTTQRIEHNGQTYRVVAIKEDASWEASTRVDIERE